MTAELVNAGLPANKPRYIFTRAARPKKAGNIPLVAVPECPAGSRARQAANQGYGVELSGGSKSDLLQVRAVAFGNSADVRDTTRDRDIETIWCGEFTRLQSLIAKDGGSLAIEHARPIGQFPRKVVEDKYGTAGDNDVVTTPRHLNR
jgi:hypothetical protein